MVCRLEKAIYGLKQSSRAWFQKFSDIIEIDGFHRYHSDHSIFTRRRSFGIVITIVYVDDIIMTGDDAGGLVEARTYL